MLVQRQHLLNNECWKEVYDAYCSIVEKERKRLIQPCVVVYTDWEYSEDILLCSKHLLEASQALGSVWFKKQIAALAGEE
jgi:hypothetical protein